MTIDIRILRDELPGQITGLAREARQEGHFHITRLVDDWSAGDIRFAREGERLLGAFMDEALVGIGGMTVEPSIPAAMRMRRFYVRPEMRGRGVGHMLALALLAHARRFRSFVTVRAGNDGAAKFWESLGFQPVGQDGYSHILELHRPGRSGLSSDGKLR